MSVLPVIPAKGVGDDVLAADWNAFVQGGFAWLDANRPMIAVYQTAAQSIPNAAFTAVTFTAETIDRSGQHSTTVNTSRVNATTDLGTYIVLGQVTYATNATGTRRAKLLDSGVTDLPGAYGIYPPASALGTAVAMGVWRPASSSAYLELLAWQDSGAALNTGISTSFQPSLTLWRMGS